MEIFSGIQLRCRSCFVSALLYRLLGWAATDNVNTVLAQGAPRMDIWQDKICFFFFSSVGRNSIAHGLKRCVHFEVRLIMVFICSLSTIIYFVHRKESGKLVLLVFAPLAAININIIIQTWPSNWTFKMQNKLRILFILKQFKYISIKNNILFDSYRSSMSCNLRLFVCLSDWILNSWFKFQFFF